MNYQQMTYAAKQRYGEVAVIGKKLIEGGNNNPMLLNLTGASLFCEHQFPEAKAVLEQAAKDQSPEGQGMFAEIGERFLAECDDYQAYWTKEQVLREQEAAAPDDQKNPHVLLTTTKEDVKIELNEDQAPNTGANVIFNIATRKYAAQALRKAAEIGWTPVHSRNNVSSPFGSVFKPAGIEASQGIMLAL